jgi:hypothetical protein
VEIIFETVQLADDLRITITPQARVPGQRDTSIVEQEPEPGPEAEEN